VPYPADLIDRKEAEGSDTWKRFAFQRLAVYPTISRELLRVTGRQRA